MSIKFNDNKGVVQNFEKVSGDVIDNKGTINKIGKLMGNIGSNITLNGPHTTKIPVNSNSDNQTTTTHEQEHLGICPNTFHISVHPDKNEGGIIQAKYYQDQYGLSIRQAQETTNPIKHLLRDLGISGSTSIEYGDLLGAWLFIDSIRDLFIKATESSQPLNVVLQMEIAQLRHLVWESLRGPILSDSKSDFLCLNQNMSYSQLIGTSQKAQALLDPMDVKVLSFIANPPENNAFNLSKFDEESVIESIKQGVDPRPLDIIRFNPKQRNHYPDLNHLFTLLDQHKPSILHLVAHGEYKPRGYVLFLLDEHGQVQPCPIDSVMKQLKRLSAPPKFIFLAVCNSGQSSSQAPSFAHQLVQELGCSFVLGMTQLAFVEDANAITSRFYQQLIKTGRPNNALSHACGYLSKDEYRLVPALYTRQLHNKLIAMK